MVACLVGYRTVVALVITAIYRRYGHPFGSALELAVLLALDVSVHVFHEQIVAQILVALDIALRSVGRMGRPYAVPCLSFF